ncbi:diguanylate cyclase [uncultured Aquabacterium sp.]|jgi:diguanylate cyclase|uniref:GGDEF domain-containing protein n=1 Tax=uncultured Aquabacterium sp. TaxID=158753 RepID=UPI002628C7F4|nr:diguanylate cyclase [uncultured Aquabacterium sp.]
MSIPGKTTEGQTPALLAKAALRRLAEQRLEPTPDNFRQAYEAEGGLTSQPAAAATDLAERDHDEGERWSTLISRVVRGAERGGRQWTMARKKESLQRVLEGSRGSGTRLHQRLGQLIASWDSDTLDAAPLEDTADGMPAAATAPVALPAASTTASAVARTPTTETWPVVASHAVAQLGDTAVQALQGPGAPQAEATLALRQALTRAQQSAGLPPHEVNALQVELTQACNQARRIIDHRHLLTSQLTQLVSALTDSLVDLAEDESWAQGQCLAMRHQISEGLNRRGMDHIQALLADTRQRQRVLKFEREQARQALKSLIHQMLQELAALGQTTDRFQDNLGRYADTIGAADTLQSLAGVVREMVAESRAVASVVADTQQRLHTEHSRATELTARVRELEDEIRQLSAEAATDPLTQVANRRGLEKAFEAERSRVDRSNTALVVALLDVDNFKKLNDQLGHNTGDEALRFLARRVSECLRPVDVVARYGGEEFVVMLPDTSLEEGQAALTRLQRTLSAEFFTHDDKKVFITFSAGATLYRAGESMEAALERADLALYEAKQSGKNRTCVG